MKWSGRWFPFHYSEQDVSEIYFTQEWLMTGSDFLWITSQTVEKNKNQTFDNVTTVWVHAVGQCSCPIWFWCETAFIRHDVCVFWSEPGNMNNLQAVWSEMSDIMPNHPKHCQICPSINSSIRCSLTEMGLVISTWGFFYSCWSKGCGEDTNPLEWQEEEGPLPAPWGVEMVPFVRPRCLGFGQLLSCSVPPAHICTLLSY